MSDIKKQEACREIIQDLLNKRAEEGLERLKVRVCGKYGLTKIPTNSEILAAATDMERKRVLSKLRVKPVRSISGINVVAVMSKPHPCPHGRCAYCPSIEGVPNSYTGREPSAMRGIQNEFDPHRQVSSRLDQLRRIGHDTGKVELIIQGGTFPSTPIEYQRSFVKGCLDALTGGESRYLDEAKWRAERSKVKNVGITFETRPDHAKERQVDEMLEVGVTKVELGVQNIYDDVYQLVERGHGVKEVVEATRILKDSGLKVCYHMMPGLPGSSHRRDIEAFQTLFENPAFKPDMLKIYPCLVLEGSKIYDWWKAGKYRSYTTEEAADFIAEVKSFVPSWVRIMRVQRDIPAQLIVDGVKKSNLRQIVAEKLRSQGVRCGCIRCREVGHRMLMDGVEPDLKRVEMTVQKYEASEGLEVFIAFEDLENDALIGYLRLRIPSPKAHRPEIALEKASLVRELHIYGPLVPVGKRVRKAWQHRGYGKALLKEAERISMGKYDRRRILVTSALGSRDYFRRLGYELQGPYMAKNLHG